MDPALLAEAADVLTPPGAIDDAAVRWLDAASRSTAFDDETLRHPIALDIRRQIAALVQALKETDPRHFLARQGVISRLTGADVEARLTFELAAQNVLAQAQRLRRTAAGGEAVREMLARTGVRLDAEQARFEVTINQARALLAMPGPRDEFHLARFERKFANLMALHAANDMAIEQITLSDKLLTTLLDRLADIDGLLLPLWQRQLLAVTSASGPRGRAAGKDLLKTSQTLIETLQQDTSA